MVNRESKETRYQVYVTDMLKYIVNNTAGGEERYKINARYADTLDVKKKKKRAKDKKKEPTQEDIIKHMKEKLSKL